jgi:hypothetical protein
LPFVQRIQYGQRFCDYPCTGTQHLAYNGSCIDSCVLPFVSRNTLGKDFCDFPVGNTANFLYWDDTFSPECTSPATPKIELDPINKKLCLYKCESTEFLYWNGTCATSCPFPLVNRTRQGKNFCDYPCSSNEYLYPNSECKNSCFAPFHYKIYGGDKFCYTACNQPNDYYYWNGTCSSTCNLPLKSHDFVDYKWCIYPCPNDQFLVDDGSCSDTCNGPLHETRKDGLKYCINTCSSSEFLFWNGSCISKCEHPLRIHSINTGKMCLLPCRTEFEYYDELTGECRETCDVPSVNNDGLYLKCMTDLTRQTTLLDFFIEPSNASRPTLATFVKSIHYIRYLDMPFSERLERFAKSGPRNILTFKFGQHMPLDIASSIPKHPLPDVFERYHLHSSFLVNFWHEIVSWVIIILAALIFTLCELVCKLRHWELWQAIFRRLKILSQDGI